MGQLNFDTLTAVVGRDPAKNEAFEQLLSALDNEDFPKVCLPQEEELHFFVDAQIKTTTYYEVFLYYLILGPRRTRLAACNGFRTPGTPPIVANHLSERDQESNIAHTGRPDHTPRFYVATLHAAKRFRWVQRAIEWDTYLGKQFLVRSSSKLLQYADKALDVLGDKMENSRHDVNKINAAKAILDKALPNLKQTDVNLTIKKPTEASDDELFALISAEQRMQLESQKNFLAGLPEPPQIADFIEGEFTMQPAQLKNSPDEVNEEELRRIEQMVEDNSPEEK